MAGQYGYAGKILRVDLSSRKLTDIPSSDYTDTFVGGKGLAARVYWDEVPPQVGPLDPENRLIIATGPLGGFPGLAGSVYVAHGKSPDTVPQQYSYSHSVGFWGARLKLAGYDALIVHGKSDRPVYLDIENGRAELRNASHLWGKGAVTVRGMLKAELGSSTHVLAIGPAGENLVTFANMLGEGDSSAGQGFGAVMGSKGLKAITVRGNGRMRAARPEELRELVAHVRQLDKDRRTSLSASAHLKGIKERPYVCFGCISNCNVRKQAETPDGVKSKFACQSGNFYQADVFRRYGEYNEVILKANRLCDEHGLDSMGLDRMNKWLSRYYREGKLTEEETGIPLSKKGTLEYIETLVRRITYREGFGDILAGGPARAAEYTGCSVEEFLGGFNPGLEMRARPLRTDPRMYIYSGLVYAMEPREPNVPLNGIADVVREWVGWVRKMVPAEDFAAGDPDPFSLGLSIQDPEALKENIDKRYVSTRVLRGIARRFWGGDLALDFSTYDGKALAAKKEVDRSYAIECLIGCRMKWPISYVRYSEDHVGDPTLESKVLSAVTGKDVDEEGFYQIGERAFNLARAILAREGHVGRGHDKPPELLFDTPLNIISGNPDCLFPGRNGMLISLKGATLNREKFAKVMDEYYQLRGWDVATGLQTKAKLRELGLKNIVPELEQRGLVA